MQRPQQTAKAGWTCEGMLETKSNKGACSIAVPEPAEGNGAGALLEKILQRGNLNAAYKRVKRNGGAIKQALEYYKEGYVGAVDLDLAKYKVNGTNS